MKSFTFATGRHYTEQPQVLRIYFDPQDARTWSDADWADAAEVLFSDASRGIQGSVALCRVALSDTNYMIGRLVLSAYDRCNYSEAPSSESANSIDSYKAA